MRGTGFLLTACSLSLLLGGPNAAGEEQAEWRRDNPSRARLDLFVKGEPPDHAQSLDASARAGIIDEATSVVRIVDRDGAVKATIGLAGPVEDVSSIAHGGVEVTMKAGWTTTIAADGKVSERWPSLPPPARLAVFERILEVPTDDIAVLGDRVAVVERSSPAPGSPVAVWVISERAKVRLELPDLAFRWDPWAARLRFDRQGLLTLWMSGSTAGDSPMSATWTWHGRWVENPSSTAAPPAASVGAGPAAPYPAESTFAGTDGKHRPWVTGALGAFAFDAGAWWRAAELPQALNRIIARGSDQIWVTSSAGLYRGKLVRTEPLVAHPLLEPRPTPPAVAVPAPLAEFSKITTLDVRIERVELPVAGGAPLSSALSVSSSRDGSLVFNERKRSVALKDGKAGLLPSNALRAHVDGDLLPSPSVVAEQGSGRWAFSCRDDDLLPAAMRSVGSAWTWAPEIPHACYRGATFASDGSLWAVGALRNDRIDWPIGEGLLVHATGGHAEWIRFVRSPLLAVATTPAGDVWAGGYDGELARISGSKVTAYQLPGAPWVLALQAAGNAVYAAGEGFIAKLEGNTLAIVPSQHLPPGTWRSLALDQEGTLWAVGDAGIVRLNITAK